MLEKFLIISAYGAIVASITAVLARFCAKKNMFSGSYRAVYDPFFYVFGVLCVGTFGVLFFSKDTNDIVTNFSLIKYFAVFLSALCLYVFSLFEAKRVFKTLIVMFSIGGAFLMISGTINPFGGILPWRAAVFVVGLMMGVLALSGGVMNALVGVFETLVFYMALGVVLLFFVGGMPFYVAFLGALWVGSSIALRQVSLSYNQIILPSNACRVLLFLFAMIFCTTAVNEFCAPSILILSAYPLSELILACFLVYVLKKEPSDLAVNTVYVGVYQKGVTVDALHIALLKLGAINIFLCLFQVYSPNPLTLPVLAFLINGWLLSKLYHFDEEELPVKTVRGAFIESVKDGFRNIKKKD